MAEFEKIKIAVNEAEHQAMLSTYEGRIEFYQNTIDQIKNIVPGLVFETSDLVPLFNDPKSFLVDKIIIEQDEFMRFANTMAPESYRSLTKVNFKLLDTISIKIMGV